MTFLANPILLLALCAQAPGPPPSDPLAEGRALAEKEEWAEAVEKLRAVLRAHPDAPQAPEARFWVGFCLVKQGEDAEAIETLRPFETTLSQDTWADDALLHLGSAYHSKGDADLAIAAWKRLLDKYPESVWRSEALLKIVDILFNDSADYAACLPYCERVVKEVSDPEASSPARLCGAYCLNALRRFDDAERWADQWLDRGHAHEEAWRRVLAAQRDLIQGHPDAAMATLEAIEADFPDLDEGARLDILLQTASVLRKHGHPDRARTLLGAEFRRPSRRAEDDFSALLEALSQTFGPDHRADFLDALSDLSTDPKVPMPIRVAARDRHAQALREDDHDDRAADLLRKALADEPSEYGRVKAAIALANLLAEAKEDRTNAARVLADLLPRLRRRDLAHQVREELAKYRTQPDVQQNE